MRANSQSESNEYGAEPRHTDTPASSRRRAVACVDTLDYAEKTLSYATFVADAFDAKLTLLHVIECQNTFGGIHDPVSSNLLRQEASSRLERLAQRCEHKFGLVNATVLEGRPADQICNWANNHDVDLIILNARRRNEREYGFGETAQKIIDKAPGSILIVPVDRADTPFVSTKKLLVFLDGSARAESVLPLAVSLAESKQFELVLVHAVPQPEMTEIGPVETEDEKLRSQIIDRNEAKALSYFNRLKMRLSEKPISVREKILKGGDVRRLLHQAIIDEKADMAVISSHGHGSHPDVATGSVARYLMTHLEAPLLMVRNLQERFSQENNREFSTVLRFPNKNTA